MNPDDPQDRWEMEMGDLLRMIDPKKEKLYANTAERARESIYAALSDQSKTSYSDQITVALARTVYEVFYQMHRGGLPADQICIEVDDFLKLMQDNLPGVKKNVWRWQSDGEE